MTREEMADEALRLNVMAAELLSLNIQEGSSRDHIGAAEGLLAFYEQSLKLQLEIFQLTDQDFGDEGSLRCFREAAMMHLAIAKTIRM